MPRPPHYIIIDECHHSTANSYKTIFECFPDARKIGFTATPTRLGKGGLGEVFQKLIQSVSTKWLIANDFLSPYRYFSVPVADVSGVSVQRGEYSATELSKVMENAYVYGETIRNYKKLADDKKTIVYCVSVESAKQTAEKFNTSGYTAASLDSKTPKEEREKIMKTFRENKIKILCNCELFGEGLDVPDVECVILLRKTKSLTLYIQQSMRSMRYKPDKTAIIIDHVGNVFEHGLPDADRRWSLDSKTEKQENEELVKICPVCFYVMEPDEDACPECGYEFRFSSEARHRQEKQEVDVDLVEISEQGISELELKDKVYSYYKTITDWDELDLFRKAKGFKFAWAIHKALELGIEIPAKYNYAKRVIGKGVSVF